eukprot:gene891-520_t
MPRPGSWTSPADLDDRLQRALQEVHHLKCERNDLESKLRYVQTQFRRLTADMKLSAPPDIPVVSAATEMAAAPKQEGAQQRVPPKKTTPKMVKAQKSKNATASAHRPGTLREDPAAVWTGARPSRLGPLPTANHRSPRSASTSPPRGHSGDAAAARPSSSGPFLHASPLSALAELQSTQLALRCCTAELEQLRAANEALRQAASGGETPNASKTKLSVEVTRLSGEKTILEEQLRLLRGEVERLQLAQQQTWQTNQQQITTLTTQLQSAVLSQRQMETQYQQAVQGLTAERDLLKQRTQHLEEQLGRETQRAAQAETRAAAEAQRKAAELQRLATTSPASSEPREVAEAVQVQTLSLQRRVQQLEADLRVSKQEGQRLLAELQQSQAALGDAKRLALQATQEKRGLQLHADRAKQLEADLDQRSEEVRRLEQQLLDAVASLQSCNRETAEAVRREAGQQLADLQAELETAHQQRRESEMEALACRQQVAEAKRVASGLREDVAAYKRHMEKLEREFTSSSDLASAAAVGEATGASVMAQYAKRGGMTEEEMHRVFAVAALRKRSSFSERESGLVPDGALTGALGAEANQALDLFESLGWDETWEAKQLREALATAALDLELANQHAQQEKAQTEQQREALRAVTAERDALLEENVEMRRRLSHVQTVFAKQQLQAYRAALTLQKSEGDSSPQAASGLGQISLCIRAVEMENTILSALGLEDRQSPTALFFSLDGLEAYDTMLSPTFYSLQAIPVDVLFQYDGLPPDDVTVAEIQRTVFLLQLHHTTEDGSQVVAQAELPGTELLHAREVALESTLRLVDGEGVVVGHVLLERCCRRLMLPVVLGAPLAPATSPTSAAPPDGLVMSALEVRAALVALRSVVAIRVQVFRLQGYEPPAATALPEVEEVPEPGAITAAAATRPPDPYIFYTTSSPVPSLSPIRDTVVRSTGGGPLRRPDTPGGDAVFDQEPVEHRVAVDRDLVQFLCYGSIVFVVFDANSTDIEHNLGTVELPLKPLLESPQAMMRTTEVLHPRGTLSVGLSWKAGRIGREATHNTVERRPSSERCADYMMKYWMLADATPSRSIENKKTKTKQQQQKNNQPTNN